MWLTAQYESPPLTSSPNTYHCIKINSVRVTRIKIGVKKRTQTNEHKNTNHWISEQWTRLTWKEHGKQPALPSTYHPAHIQVRCIESYKNLPHSSYLLALLRSRLFRFSFPLSYSLLRTRTVSTSRFCAWTRWTSSTDTEWSTLCVLRLPRLWEYFTFSAWFDWRGEIVGENEIIIGNVSIRDSASTILLSYRQWSH